MRIARYIRSSAGRGRLLAGLVGGWLVAACGDGAPGGRTNLTMPTSASASLGTSANDTTDAQTATTDGDADTTGSDDGEEETGQPSGCMPSDDDSEISHARDVQPIWDAHCNQMSCHDGTFPPDLRSSAAYDRLVCRPAMPPQVDLELVAPGSVEDSYVWHKLEDTNVAVGARMPFNADPLSADEMEVLEAWIEAGAPR